MPNTITTRTLPFVALLCVGVASLAAADHGHDHGHAQTVKELIAVMQPTAGNQTAGTVTFTAVDGGVQISGTIHGLQPNAKHAIHIHEFGDLRKDDGTGTGGHYNPEGHDHGLPETEMRHAGDLGNLETDAEGKATLELTVDNISLVGAKNPIVGRAVIIHEKMDDGGQPTGNAGPRISQGVIGVANPKL